MATEEKKLLKLEIDCLKAHDHDETVTKHIMFPLIEIPGKSGAEMNLSTYGVWIFTL